MDKVSFYRGPDGLYRWRRRSENGEIVAGPQEGYQSKGHCMAMARTLNKVEGVDVTFDLEVKDEQ